MAAYLIIEGTISDSAKWNAYRKAVVPLTERFGGRHLNQPGGVTLLEGTRDWIAALFEFPTMDALQDFWESPEYVPVKAIREGAATLDIRAVPGAKSSAFRDS